MSHTQYYRYIIVQRYCHMGLLAWITRSPATHACFNSWLNWSGGQALRAEWLYTTAVIYSRSPLSQSCRTSRYQDFWVNETWTFRQISYRSKQCDCIHKKLRTCFLWWQIKMYFTAVINNNCDRFCTIYMYLFRHSSNHYLICPLDNVLQCAELKKTSKQTNIIDVAIAKIASIYPS